MAGMNLISVMRVKSIRHITGPIRRGYFETGLPTKIVEGGVTAYDKAIISYSRRNESCSCCYETS